MKDSMIVNIVIEFDEPISERQAEEVLENIRVALRRQLENAGIAPELSNAVIEFMSVEYGNVTVPITGTVPALKEC